MGRSVVYSISVNCLYGDRVRVGVRERVSGRVMDRVKVVVRVRRPDSSGNLLTRRKLHYALRVVCHICVCHILTLNHCLVDMWRKQHKLWYAWTNCVFEKKPMVTATVSTNTVHCAGILQALW